MKSDLFTYLNEYNDEIKEVTEIDALVFAFLSYLPLDSLTFYDTKIIDAYNNLKNTKCHIKKKDLELFRLIANNKRYKDLVINNVIRLLNYDNSEDFLALTINLPDSIFISFRGTTDNIISFKESLEISYHDIKACIDATNYLNNSKAKKIYLTGHSKGGYLAVKSFLKAKPRIRKRIINVYNFDGPIDYDLDNNDKDQDKIINILPMDSIVGRLLYDDTVKKVIMSHKKGVMSHDFFTWIIKDHQFVKTSLSDNSDKIKKGFDEILLKVPKENRQEFINKLFKIIIDSGISNVSNIKLNNLIKLFVNYKELNEEEKEFFMKTIKTIINSLKMSHNS